MMQENRRSIGRDDKPGRAMDTAADVRTDRV